MNLRYGMTVCAWCCALSGLSLSMPLIAQDNFQSPRLNYELQNPSRSSAPVNPNSFPGGRPPATNANSEASRTPQSFPPQELQRTAAHNRSLAAEEGQIHQAPVSTAATSTAPASTYESSAAHASTMASSERTSTDRRRIGSAESGTSDSNGESASQQLTLVSPGKLLTAVMFVVFLILVTARFWKKRLPGASLPIPQESMTVLGERKLNKNHSICLVRLGSRVLVLGASADGLRTLTEITDPVEIDFLSGMARSSQADSVFTSALGSFMKKGSPKSPLNAKEATSSARPAARSAEVSRV